MKKGIFIILSLLLLSQVMFSQIEYGYERSNKDPWRYGLKFDGSYDWATQNQGLKKKYGFKAGFVAEKHLIYNIYFQPAITLYKKGYKSTITNGFSENIDGYFLAFDASIQLKFGDERLKKGFLISLTPYFTYGLFGNSTQKSLDHNDTVHFNNTYTYNTFDVIKKEDLGFILGAGYDFNKHWELNANYYFGLLRVKEYTNYRWRGFTVGLEYYF
jgi:hypothetical protein